MPIKDKYDVTEDYVISESPKYFFSSSYLIVVVVMVFICFIL